jgi:hypothetical protein
MLWTAAIMRPRALLLALLPLATACADYESAFIEGEDVRIELPGEWAFRAEQGDVYTLIRDTTDDVNAWVTETVEGVSQGIEYFNRWQETDREGDFRVYGPWTDTLGRNVNWVLKVSGDAEQTSYEVWVADVTTWNRDKFQLFLAGDLLISGDELELRSGGFVIDFDVLEQHDGLKRWDLKQNHYGGKIAVTFERDTTNLKKYIDLDYQEFWVDVAGEDVYESDETYSYRRELDGSGTFDLALTSSFESQEWSGPGIERMTLESRWDASEAGRARGMILEEQGSGDLSGGDMIIEECFTSEGSLTWRTINEPYASELADYNMGDPSSCVFAEL